MFSRRLRIMIFLICSFIVFSTVGANAVQYNIDKEPIEEIEDYIREIMKKAKIPGMSIVIINGDEAYTKSFGYADVNKNINVTSKTIFELASCSKSFTALAALKLQDEGLLNLEDSVSKYLPWFKARYNGKEADIKVKHLLYHTSGIPWESISYIHESNSEDALINTAKNLIDIELKNPPGSKYEYATINYDVVGAIIENVSGMKYEEYMKKNIFQTLGLKNTWVGASQSNKNSSKGHKISFLKAREYEAPIFRGNNPAGYIVTNGEDIERWLKIQMGMISTGLDEIIRSSHIPDRSVEPNKGDLSSYAMGWSVYQNGSGEISHSGLNPNFTSYIAFRTQDKIGVAVLANSNSRYTNAIGKNIMGFLKENKGLIVEDLPKGIDKACTVISVILAIYLVLIIVFIISLVSQIARKKRRYQGIGFKKLIKIIIAILTTLPFFYGIHIMPRAIAGVTWEVARVWNPNSFIFAVYLVIGAIIMSLILYMLNLIFKSDGKYKKDIPMLAVLGLVSGISNAAVIFLITSALQEDANLYYTVYYYALALIIYIFGRKVIETKLIKMTNNIIYDLRMNIMEKIFTTSYQSFEKIDVGRIYATINNDTEEIGNASGIIVNLITSIITVVCAFIYLFTISAATTTLVLGIILVVATIYYIVTQKTAFYWEDARDAQNSFMDTIDGLVKGFKELSLHSKKKHQYRDEVKGINEKYRGKRILGMTKFLNAFLVGESMFIIVLGAISFGFNLAFPQISMTVLRSFVMILLYTLNPINGIMRSMPRIMRVKVSWQRVQSFIKEIPGDYKEIKSLDFKIDKKINSIKAENLKFEYNGDGEKKAKFTVGPIDIEIHRGEVFFIIGGNGSGKTTLAKLLTGLYAPKSGKLMINDKEVKFDEVGEYISTVFSDYYLFQKLYDIDYKNKEHEIKKYLKLLDLEGKVEIKEGKFSTVNLSSGQRKRLALLRCYLEDRPIYLFDEWAADQDPEFRKVFYNSLLPKMKEEGKIVIAITHDDHYFDIADKIIKMDMGHIENLETAFTI